MRVLLVHNYYNSKLPSGENQVFDSEVALLRRFGYEVKCFTLSSDVLLNKGLLGKIIGAISVPWNGRTSRLLRQSIEEFRPDVVHFHNTFPLISPAAFYAVPNNVARVLTLHNFRLFCAAAVPLRGGIICTECMDKNSSLPALAYGCYRQSRMATLPLVIGIELHRALRTWARKVDAFIVLSEFHRDLMVQSGLPASNVCVKPNFFPGSPSVVPFQDREDEVVFVGRLSEEKGVFTLIRSWILWGDSAPLLKIVGTGPQLEDLKNAVRLSGSERIVFLGGLSPERAQREIAHARLLIVPSECYEGFPLVLREAFALATPVAVSNLGPLPSIVRNGEAGIMFSPANSDHLLETVKLVYSDNERMRFLSIASRREYEVNYTEAKNFSMLENIYRFAIDNMRSRFGA